MLVTDAEVAAAVIATRTPDGELAFNGMETLWTLVKIVPTGCTTSSKWRHRPIRRWHRRKILCTGRCFGRRPSAFRSCVLLCDDVSFPFSDAKCVRYLLCLLLVRQTVYEPWCAEQTIYIQNTILVPVPYIYIYILLLSLSPHTHAHFLSLSNIYAFSAE